MQDLQLLEARRTWSFIVVLISMVAVAPKDVYGQNVTEGISKVFEDVVLLGTNEALAEFSSAHHSLDNLRVFNQSLLAHAAGSLDKERLKIILENHDSLDAVDSTGNTPIMHALMAGRIENALLLFQHGASLEGINDQGYTVRVLAEEAGLPNFGPEYPSKLTLPKIAQDEANQMLLLAAEVGDIEIMKFALTQGAAPDTRAENGLQTAHVAALGGHVEAFDWIMSREDAPNTWASIDAEGQELTLIDFIIAGEGGGDHARAQSILMNALTLPSVAKQFETGSEKYRQAMQTVGYSQEVIQVVFRKPASSAVTAEEQVDTGSSLAEIKQVANALFGDTSSQKLKSANRQIQAADTPRDAYRPAARLLQESLRLQGCSVSQRGSLSAGTADGLFGAGSAQGIEAYNRSISSVESCRAMSPLEPIGSKVEGFVQSYFSETWLPQAMENLTSIAACSEIQEQPICGCGADPIFEAKNGVCVKKTCDGGTVLNSSTGRCDPKPAKKSTGFIDLNTWRGKTVHGMAIGEDTTWTMTIKRNGTVRLNNSRGETYSGNYHIAPDTWICVNFHGQPGRICRTAYVLRDGKIRWLDEDSNHIAKILRVE